MVIYFVRSIGTAKIYLTKYGHDDTNDLKVRAANSK